MQVAHHPEFRAPISTPTNLHLLIDSLFATGSPLQAIAATALSLVSDDGNAAKNIFTLGGLQGLVPLLSASHEAVTRVAAATTITNLARYYPPSRESILLSEDGAGLGLILAILASNTNAISENKVSEAKIISSWQTKNKKQKTKNKKQKTKNKKQKTKTIGFLNSIS
jgi:hypothetical protein